MKILYKLLTLAAIITLTSNCSTLADAISAKGSGSVRSYNKPYDTVWDATITVVQSSELNLITSDKKTGQILAQRGISLLSYGENVAIFIERNKGKDSTSVEVVWKRALATNIFGANWEKKIIEALDMKLGTK